MSARALFHPPLRVQRRWERERKTEGKKEGRKKEVRGRLKTGRRKRGQILRRVGRKERRKKSK